MTPRLEPPIAVSAVRPRLLRPAGASKARAVAVNEEAARTKRRRRAARMPPLPLGYTLRGRYKLVEILGQGGMSTVYGAIDERRVRARAFQSAVAVKVLNTDPSKNPDMVELLYREARRMHEFNHPNIVRVFDWDQAGPICFIVMERLEGRTLAAMARDQGPVPFPPRAARTIIEGVANGLLHAHARGIIHADLKPGNVFITDAGEVKLLDFGFAHRLDGPAVASDDEEATVAFLSRVGALTPTYASAELLEGRRAVPEDDLFAFAILVYLLLAGRHPYDRKSALVAEREGLKPQRPPRLSGRRWRALKTALAIRRDQRTITVEALRDVFLQDGWLDRLLGRSWAG